jgi:hypothetical protein
VLTFFQFSSEVAGLARYAEKGDIEFNFDSPRVMSVRLSKGYPNGSKPREAGDAVCTSTTTVEPPDGKIADELKAGWLLPVVDGKIQAGDPTTLFIDSVIGDLRAAMTSTATLFRWRQGVAEGPPDPCHTLKASYSNDGKTWREIMLVRGIKIRFGLTTCAPEDGVSEQVVEWANAGTEEPLGRQLFREAWSQRDLRPRSALVIGVAAAEVGFKKLVGSLVPQAQWLVDEVQTPSLSKMLSKFLPTLPVKARFSEKSIRPPSALLRQLEKAIESRNKLVHAGEPPPKPDDLMEILRAVNDFLWICDLYQGHAWAARHISVSLLNAWEGDHTEGADARQPRLSRPPKKAR